MKQMKKKLVKLSEKIRKQKEKEESVDISNDLKQYDSLDDKKISEAAEDDEFFSEDMEHLPASESELEAERNGEDISDDVDVLNEEKKIEIKKENEDEDDQINIRDVSDVEDEKREKETNKEAESEDFDLNFKEVNEEEEEEDKVSKGDEKVVLGDDDLEFEEVNEEEEVDDSKKNVCIEKNKQDDLDEVIIENMPVVCSENKLGIVKKNNFFDCSKSLNKKRQRESTKKKGGKFSFCSKSLFGTWPRCDVSKEDMLNFLVSKGADRAIVAHEKHAFNEKEDEEFDELKFDDGTIKEEEKDIPIDHLHCWAEFDKKIHTTDSRFFDYKGFHCHIESVRNKKKVIKYVTKKKDYVEHNFNVEQWILANKDHTKTINERLLKGEITVAEAIEEDPDLLLKIEGIQRSLRIYQNLKANEKSRGDVKCFWLYGEPGIGKSRSVLDRFPYAYRKDLSKWWDGYVSQKVCVIEEFSDKTKANYLKIWADNYPFNAEVKGGYINPVYEVLIITSNYSIDELFEEEYEDCDMRKFIKRKRMLNERLLHALHRRFREYEMKIPELFKYDFNVFVKLPKEIAELPY